MWNLILICLFFCLKSLKYNSKKSKKYCYVFFIFLIVFMLLAKNLNWYACLKNNIKTETYDIYYKFKELTIKNYKKFKTKRIENLSEVKKPPHFENVRRFYTKIREVRRTFYKVRRTLLTVCKL